MAEVAEHRLNLRLLNCTRAPLRKKKKNTPTTPATPTPAANQPSSLEPRALKPPKEPDSSFSLALFIFPPIPVPLSDSLTQGDPPTLTSDELHRHPPRSESPPLPLPPSLLSLSSPSPSPPSSLPTVFLSPPPHQPNITQRQKVHIRALVIFMHINNTWDFLTTWA